MTKVKLIFFKGCPNVEKAKDALKSAGISEFEEVCQDDLTSNDPLRGYSSPTILMGDEIIYGSKIDGSGSCSAENLTSELITTRLEGGGKIGSKGQSLAVVGGVVSAVLASSCCIGPVLLAFLGIGGAGAALALQSYRPVFMVLAVVFLAIAFFLTYRKASKQSCESNQTCASGKFPRAIRKLLWGGAIVVVLLLLFPFVWDVGDRQVNAITGDNMVVRTYFVKGMTCGGCEYGVKQALIRAGVKEENIVDVDHSKPDPGNQVGMAIFKLAKDGYEGNESDCKLVKEIRDNPGYVAYWDLSNQDPCNLDT